MAARRSAKPAGTKKKTAKKKATARARHTPAATDVRKHTEALDQVAVQRIIGAARNVSMRQVVYTT